MAILVKTGNPVKGTPYNVELNKTELLANSVVQADSYFNSSSHWKYVSVNYKSATGNQSAVLKFDVSQDPSEFSLTFSEVALSEFEVTDIIIQDFDNGYLVIPRSSLNAAEFDLAFASILQVGLAETWGYNFNGQLANGNRDTQSSRVSVVGASEFTKISAGGNFCIALAENGTPWVSGDNFVGVLGLGDTVDRSSFVQVMGFSDIAAVSSTNKNSIILRSDGTIWAAGSDANQQLGGTGNRSSHVKIPFQSNFKALFESYSDGSSELIMGIKSDGTVWGVGQGGSGSLGGNDTPNNVSSPILAIGVSDAAFGFNAQSPVFGNYAMVIKSDGTLWAAGKNEGTFGDNTATSRSTFAQVTTISDVMFACGSVTGSTYAIKSDGTMWVTGINSFGQLGLGNTSNVSSFVQVTGHSNFKKVSAGRDFVVALKSDGSLWSCGNGSDFRLGNGTDNASRSSFIQVAGAADVFDVSSGTYHTIILKNN